MKLNLFKSKKDQTRLLMVLPGYLLSKYLRIFNYFSGLDHLKLNGI